MSEKPIKHSRPAKDLFFRGLIVAIMLSLVGNLFIVTMFRWMDNFCSWPHFLGFIVSLIGLIVVLAILVCQWMNAVKQH